MRIINQQFFTFLSLNFGRARLKEQKASRFLFNLPGKDPRQRDVHPAIEKFLYRVYVCLNILPRRSSIGRESRSRCALNSNTPLGLRVCRELLRCPWTREIKLTERRRGRLATCNGDVGPTIPAPRL